MVYLIFSKLWVYQLKKQPTEAILVILYSQSGIEHVHVQCKTYKKGRFKVLKSPQIINNFVYRLFRIYIIIVLRSPQ